MVAERSDPEISHRIGYSELVPWSAHALHFGRIPTKRCPRPHKNGSKFDTKAVKEMPTASSGHQNTSPKGTQITLLSKLQKPYFYMAGAVTEPHRPAQGFSRMALRIRISRKEMRAGSPWGHMELKCALWGTTCPLFSTASSQKVASVPTKTVAVPFPNRSWSAIRTLAIQPSEPLLMKFLWERSLSVLIMSSVASSRV